jgi:quinoprotein glucose dehydrogenase
LSRARFLRGASALALSLGVLPIRLAHSASPSAAGAKNKTATGDAWLFTGGDAANTHYSPLAQIDASNAKSLKVAWTWESPDNALDPSKAAERPGTGKAPPAYGTKGGPGPFKATPLFASYNQISAIDPTTGATVWNYDPQVYLLGRRPANTGWQNRGLAYWPGDGKEEARVLFAAGTGDLIAVSARTGAPLKGFGKDGRADLQAALIRHEEDRRVVGFGSPPIVINDVIVVGCIITDTGRAEGLPPGHIQGFDVRTGKLLWVFHTVPKPGEPGSETWEGDRSKYAGSANAWGPLAGDEELGMVYAATGSTSNDYYGGYRHGDNLYANTILAIEARTGKLRWHFQAVHHDLWDYDFPCAPTLADIVVDGKPIKALAQISKQGFTYVFDRVTGKPVWPIEERPVPQSTVGGEKTSPTQPFPTKPAAFSRQGITPDDLIDFTPELRAEAEKVASPYVMGPLFMPPVKVGENGKRGTFMVPPVGGGGNYGGAGFDPELGYLFLDATNNFFIIGVSEREPEEGAKPGTFNPDGSVVAINLNTGENAWKVPHGDGPRNHEAIKHLNLPPLGASRHMMSGSAPLVTKTLLFMNQVQAPGMAVGTTGFFLRAFDKRTGAVVWEHEFKEPPHGIPMTYEQNGKQYVALATGGDGVPQRLVAFAL